MRLCESKIRSGIFPTCFVSITSKDVVTTYKFLPSYEYNIHSYQWTVSLLHGYHLAITNSVSSGQVEIVGVNCAQLFWGWLDFMDAEPNAAKM